MKSLDNSQFANSKSVTYKGPGLTIEEEMKLTLPEYFLYLNLKRVLTCDLTSEMRNKFLNQDPEAIAYIKTYLPALQTVHDYIVEDPMFGSREHDYASIPTEDLEGRVNYLSNWYGLKHLWMEVLTVKEFVEKVIKS